MIRFFSARSAVVLGSAVLTGMLSGCAQHSRDSYVVFFESDSTTLGSTALAVVAKAAEAAKREHAIEIDVSGSAGKNGDPAVLKQLADDRAKAVARQLVADGADELKVTIKPGAPVTVEDSRVALRRVSITIVPGI